MKDEGSFLGLFFFFVKEFLNNMFCFFCVFFNKMKKKEIFYINYIVYLIIYN